MCEAKDFPPSERDELMGLVTQLQGQVAQLTAAKEELHKQVAELKRAGKHQAAPFSKGGRSSRPKRPGRKPGMGSFSYRKSPSPDEVTEPLVEVAVAEDTCPGCGGRLESCEAYPRHPAPDASDCGGPAAPSLRQLSNRRCSSSPRVRRCADRIGRGLFHRSTRPFRSRGRESTHPSSLRPPCRWGHVPVLT